VTTSLSISSADAGRSPSEPARMPRIPTDLLDDVRSDYVDEIGAVFIYRGILCVAGDPDLRRFARDYLQTEQHHLLLMDKLLPARRSSTSTMSRSFGSFTLSAAQFCLAVT